jgi:hypothetical protein
MGYGSYSYDAHAALTAARRGTNVNEVFTRGGCHPSMNPFGVRVRESRDCEAHPESLAIIFALDVSGSMGTIPEQLARKTLPDFMRALLNSGITDPQVLFMGIGNAVSDVAPLQIGQYESSEKLIDQWLTRLFLEGGGSGGNENYELAMYFAARHTAMDCFEKRHRRGYLFLTGDEPPNPVVSRHEVQQLIGDVLPDDVPITEMIEELQRAFEPFFLIPDPGRARKVGRDWRDLLGERVVVMESPDDTSYVAAGLVSLLEESEPSLDALVERLCQSGLPTGQADRVAKSLSGFAAALERDGTPHPRSSRARLARRDDESGFDR